MLNLLALIGVYILTLIGVWSGAGEPMSRAGLDNNTLIPYLVCLGNEIGGDLSTIELTTKNQFWLVKALIKRGHFERLDEVIQNKTFTFRLSTLIEILKYLQMNSKPHLYSPDWLKQRPLSKDPYFLETESEEAWRCVRRQAILLLQSDDDLEYDLFAESDGDLLDGMLMQLKHGKVSLFLEFISRNEFEDILGLLHEEARMVEVLLRATRWNNLEARIKAFNEVLHRFLSQQELPFDKTVLSKRLIS